MSATEVAWVWKHSPYTGALFNVHMAIADSANDDNDRRFWMASANLAQKARTTPATARKALARLVADGFLEVTGAAIDRQKSGKPSEYRFLFPDDAVTVYAPRRRTKPVRSEHTPDLCPDNTPPAVDDAPDTPPVSSEHTTCVPTTHVTQENPSDLKKNTPQPPKGAVSDSSEPTFEDFWRRWPRSRRMAKPKCEIAFARAVKRGTAPSVIVAAVDAWLAHYAAEKTDERYIPHTTTWLHEQRWETPPPTATNTAPETRSAPTAPWLSTVLGLRAAGASTQELEELIGHWPAPRQQAAREAFNRKDVA